MTRTCLRVSSNRGTGTWTLVPNLLFMLRATASRLAAMEYEEEDTCMACEEEDTCMAYE